MFLSDKLLAFRTGPVEHGFSCRKRSECRLKNNISCTDIRIWSLDCEDRRKAFLDLFGSCQKCPHIGNYVPICEVLKALGIAVPKITDPESPVTRCLRFIFNNFRKNDGFTVARSRSPSPLPKTGDKTHSAIQSYRRRYIGPLESNPTSYGGSSRSEGYNAFFTGNQKVKFKSAESSSVIRVEGMKKITQSTSTIIEHVSQTSETETYNTSLSGIKRGSTSTANEYNIPIRSAQNLKYGKEKFSRNKKDEYYTSTSSGYPFKNASSEYNRSGQMSANKIKKGNGLVSSRTHDHVSPEFCTEMCLYLKEQLKHVHELILKRDLLEKQLKYHETNLPRKIKFTEKSPDRLRRRRTESASSVSTHKTYSANPVQKNRQIKMEGSKQKHKSPQRVVRTKSKERKLHLVKRSVSTTIAVAASSSENIENAKLLSNRRHISPCNLEEFDKFVNEVKHVLSGVLKQFEVSDESVQSLSEETFIRSYIEETPEYRLDISQMGQKRNNNVATNSSRRF